LMKKRWYYRHQEERKAAAARYRQKEGNRDKALAYLNNYYRTNKPRIKAKQREYAERVKEKTVAQHREYYARPEIKLRRRNHFRTPEGKAQMSMWNRLKHARRRSAVGVCTKQQWLARVEYYGWRCAYCRIVLTMSTLTMDHAIPVSRNGAGWPSNLVPACKFCNSKKKTRTYTEYMAILAKKVCAACFTGDGMGR